ncbi:phiSA1p31-related protein [Streptomyces spectabilis]|uniref:phiSA1p31-related protein n=1 Tax=Streptomyces spectabilis TaxID=68270 RepID=UPI0033E63287
MTEFKVGQKVKHDIRGAAEVSYGPYNSLWGGQRYVIRLNSGMETAVSPGTISAIPESPKFAVGDKVTLSTRRGAKATVEYGPIDGGDSYLVKLVDKPIDGDPQTFTALAAVMRPMPAVSVGDRARIVRAAHMEHMHGRTGTVTSVSESWRSYRDDTHPYVVRLEEGDSIYVAELERVDGAVPADEAVKVGDVVRILEDGAFHADVKRGDLFVVQGTFRDTWDDEDGIKVNAQPGARLEHWTFRPQDFEKVSPDEVEVHDGVVYDLTARYRDNDGDYWTFLRVDGNVRGAYGARDVDRSDYVTGYSDTLAYAVKNYGPLKRVNG